MKLILVVFACFVLAVQSAMYYMVQDEIPDRGRKRGVTPSLGHENQCYDENDNNFYNPKERMSSEPGVCSRVTCLGRRESNTVVIEKATCGTVMAMPGCRIVEDLSKPYPECCPRIVHCRELAENSTASAR